MEEAAFALERRENEVVVRACCEVSALTAPALERLAAAALGEGFSGIAVDLAECPLLDSAGVRVLIRIRSRAQRAGAAFRLSRCSHPAERLLRLMHLEGILQLPPAPVNPGLPPANSRFHRIRMRVPVHVWDGLLHRTGQAQGFSLEGLMLDLPGPLRMFEVLRLELVTPDTDESFRFMGRVVRCQPGNAGPADVEYLSLDPAMQSWLQYHAAASAPREPAGSNLAPAPATLPLP